MVSHSSVELELPQSWLLLEHRMARKSFTLVKRRSGFYQANRTIASNKPHSRHYRRQPPPRNRYPPPAARRQRVGRKHSAPALSSDPVDPVRIGGQRGECRDARRAPRASAKRIFGIATAHDRCPRTVTVVSPPDSRTAGGATGLTIARGHLPGGVPPGYLGDVARLTLDCIAQNHRRHAGGFRNRQRPLARAICGVATIRDSRRRRGADRPASASHPGRSAQMIDRRRRFGDAVLVPGSPGHPPWLVGSATVGPDAIVADGSSPGTSEISNVTNLVPARPPPASRPPLMAERCLRTQFISAISAPDRNSARFTACLSSRPKAPPAGNGIKARSRRRKSGTAPRSSCPALRRPQAPGSARPRTRRLRPGTGWLASTISMALAIATRVAILRDNRVRPLQPDQSHSASTARAIAADALPAPITMVRPAGGVGADAAARTGAGWADVDRRLATCPAIAFEDRSRPAFVDFHAALL